jgi:hypothetical protein
LLLLVPVKRGSEKAREGVFQPALTLFPEKASVEQLKSQALKKYYLLMVVAF